jgi:ATP-binding cassette subfamily B protein
MSSATTATATAAKAPVDGSVKKSASGKAFDMGLFRRVMGFVRPYRGIFYLAFFLTVLLSGIGVVRPLLMGDMIDDHAMREDGRGLLILTLVVGALLLIEASVQFVQGYYTAWLGQAVTFDLRDKLYRKIIGFRLRTFDRTPIGTLVTRVISDIQTIDDIFSQGLLEILGDLLKLIVVVVVMFVVNWKLALLSLVPIPILIWATNIFKNSIQKSFQDVRTQVARLNAFVQEHLQGMSIVQTFGREQQEFSKFEAINREHRAAHIRSVFAYSVFFPVVEILAAMSMALLVWWGVKDALAGTATLGDLFAYILFISMLYRPIRQLADRFNTLQMGMVGSERVFKLLDTEASIEDTGTHDTLGLRGDIRFENVWFAYADPDAGDDLDYVLKDVSFEAHAGEMIALVGATGAGKSSIINVLSRAYEFQKGRVLVDGRDIRSYALKQLRQSISVVLQDVFLFSDTVHNNITLNDPTITREQVIAAAQAVGAHDFITALPKGYDTGVGERGGVLSTGQRQLLAFIRAYVHQPKILVLDEATSSVDSLSEQLIARATEKITQGRTSIVIAHRLSTVQYADRILVFDKGRIIEQGDHQGLLAQNGAYKKLYDLQFR